MMHFDKYSLTAKTVAIYYAKKTKNKFAENVLLGESEIANREEALHLTQFFWEMSDLAAEDYENNIDIEDGADLAHCMEKTMNIFIGYLKIMGYGDQWISESNKINGG